MVQHIQTDSFKIISTLHTERREAVLWDPWCLQWGRIAKLVRTDGWNQWWRSHTGSWWHWDRQPEYGGMYTLKCMTLSIGWILFQIQLYLSIITSGGGGTKSLILPATVKARYSGYNVTVKLSRGSISFTQAPCKNVACKWMNSKYQSLMYKLICNFSTSAVCSSGEEARVWTERENLSQWLQAVVNGETSSFRKVRVQ